MRIVLEDIRLYGRDAEAIVSLGLLQRDPQRRQDFLIAEGAELVERGSLLGVDCANGVAPTTERAKQPNR